MYQDHPELPEDFHPKMKLLMDSMYLMIEEVHLILEKEPYDLEPRDFEIIALLKASSDVLFQGQQMLQKKMNFDATAIFHHLEMLAKQGNEQAKASYERLLPSYRRAMREDLNNQQN